MRESCGYGCGRAGAGRARAEHFGGGLWAHLNTVEASSEPLLNASRLRGVRGRRQTLREQAQFFRHEPVALALQHGQFRGFEGDFLSAWLARYDTRSCERL